MEILERLYAKKSEGEVLLNLKRNSEHNVLDRKSDIEALTEHVTVLDLSIQELNIAINKKNKKYLERVQNTINKALTYVFDDEMYEFEISIDEKKIEFYLYDRTKDLKKTLNKVGGGIRVVIAVFLQMFFIETRGHHPALFCDESLYDVSEQYREKFFGFISKYCKQNNFKIVVISHDTSIEKYIENIIVLSPTYGNN